MKPSDSFYILWLQQIDSDWRLLLLIYTLEHPEKVQIASCNRKFLRRLELRTNRGELGCHARTKKSNQNRQNHGHNMNISRPDLAILGRS